MLPQQLRQVEPPSLTASAQVLEERGDQLRMDKAFADALDYYRAAQNKQPSAALENKIGITYLQLLHLPEARKSFEKSIKMDPNYADAQNNLGVMDYIKKNYRGAIKHYQKALQLNPDSASIHSNLGTAYFEKKDMEKAANEYSRALQLDTDVFEHTSNAGVSAHLSSPTDRAKYHFVIAKMYAKSGNRDRCLLYLTKAIEEGYPKVTDALDDSAFASMRKDPRFEALIANRRVMQPK